MTQPAPQQELRLAETVITLSTLLPRPPGIRLSLTASGALALLTRRGPLRITELAARLHLAQPSMTELVTRLERGGLVRRTRDDSDARAVLVALTDAGRALRERVRREQAGYLRGLLAQLDEADRRMLAAAVPALGRLGEVAAALAEEMRAAGA